MRIPAATLTFSFKLTNSVFFGNFSPLATSKGWSRRIEGLCPKLTAEDNKQTVKTRQLSRVFTSSDDQKLRNKTQTIAVSIMI